MLRQWLVLLAAGSLAMAAVISSPDEGPSSPDKGPSSPAKVPRSPAKGNRIPKELKDRHWFRGLEWGGRHHGKPFDDEHDAKRENSKIKQITIRGGDRVDGIEYTLENGREFSHGGKGGKPIQRVLDPGDYFTTAEFCLGKGKIWYDKVLYWNNYERIHWIRFNTRNGHPIEVGKATSNCNKTDGPKDLKQGIVAMHGHAGNEMNSFGVYWAPMHSDAV
ncbi:unnamed protein product [Rhizoctonia solani]|uniref:Jacalin-type lectin domain-containing protein n=1 Tax=Rhizoctonia solani TaxID=456999 RepID=A0A8H3E7C4_9AGAM|nr:unnamed protein product [Rhizoctonia solani]